MWLKQSQFRLIASTQCETQRLEKENGACRGSSSSGRRKQKATEVSCKLSFDNLKLKTWELECSFLQYYHLIGKDVEEQLNHAFRQSNFASKITLAFKFISENVKYGKCKSFYARESFALLDRSKLVSIGDNIEELEVIDSQKTRCRTIVYRRERKRETEIERGREKERKREREREIFLKKTANWQTSGCSPLCSKLHPWVAEIKCFWRSDWRIEQFTVALSQEIQDNFLTLIYVPSELLDSFCMSNINLNKKRQNFFFISRVGG